MLDLQSSGFVWTSEGDCSKGVVHFSDGIPEILLESGQKISISVEGVYYEEDHTIIPTDQGIREEKSLAEPIKIRFAPILVRTKPYTKYATEPENIFPRSSSLWYGRMVNGDGTASFVVQEIINDRRLWLSVIDPVTGQLYEKHFIQPYEFWILVMDAIEDHRRNWLDALGPESPDAVVRPFTDILEEKMTWHEIAEFAKGVRIPVFERGRTIRDTLEQLVPADISGKAREGLLLFFAWTIKRNFDIDEPVSYFYELSPLPYFKSLLEIHMRFIISGVEPPNYLKQLYILLHSIPEKEKVLSETLRERIFTRYLYRLMEFSPDWRSSIIKQISVLNKSDRVTVKFPVSETLARKSISAYQSRFVLFTNGLHLRTHVRPYAFGLRSAIIVANSHRWVHPMLSWSAHLATDKITKHIQVMVMPPSALFRAKRLLPNLIEIGYSARSWNPHLFDHERKIWTVKKIPILSSVRRKKSKLVLQNSFGDWQEEAPYQLTHKEARIIDFTNARLNLAYLSKPSGQRLLGASKKKLSEFLTDLREKGGIQTFYEFNETRLPRPMFVIAKGNPKQICSLTKSMLVNTPSSVAYLAKGNESAFIISSVPETTRDILTEELPQLGMEHGLDVRCMIPLSYRNYTSDLFQRLLKPDGTWIDNVSGLVTQVRSLLKSLPKEELDEVLQDSVCPSSILMDSPLRMKGEMTNA